MMEAAHVAKRDARLTAYYNEIDPYAAQWLRNLIAAGHIAPGDVDTRSIADVRPDDLRPYRQCHFFAGIGGWSLALRLAGWPDDRPVWTGSCPCQPFSAAGAGKAADDERHLWPRWFPLIAERRPAIVFGEQVEAAIGWGWLDAVFADLEPEGYACGAAVLPACGIGAPHIRARTWFIGALDEPKCGRNWRESRDEGCSERAPQTSGKDEGCGFVQAINSSFDNSGFNFAAGPMEGRRAVVAAEPCIAQHRGAGTMADTDGGDASAARLQRGGEQRQQPQGGGALRLADAIAGGFGIAGLAPEGIDGQPHAQQRIAVGELGDAPGGGWPRFGDQPAHAFAGQASPWASDWLPCTDGKARPVEPGTFPLLDGLSFKLGSGSPFEGKSRVGMLRAYGNAIVPQVAAAFIEAAMGAFDATKP